MVFKKLQILIIFLTFSILQSTNTEKNIQCEQLKTPSNGILINGICTRDVGNICSIACKIGYELKGSRIRECVIHKNETTIMAYWSGINTECEIKKCHSLTPNPNVKIDCTTNELTFGTICYQKCLIGYKMIGSFLRICTAIQKWSGLEAKCHLLKPLNSTQIESNFTEDADLNNLESYSLVVGNGFYDDQILIDINSLPITITGWFKSTTTENVFILEYLHNCQLLTLNTNLNSKFQFSIDGKYYYSEDAFLIKNTWTQITIILNWNFVKLFINGALETSFNPQFDSLMCLNSKFHEYARLNTKSLFLNIISKSKSKYKINELEITRFYVLSKEINEQEAAELYFICKSELFDSNVLLNWSNISLTMNFIGTDIKNPGVKYFRNSRFCYDCTIPKTLNTNIEYNYTGLSTGHSVLYNCPVNMTLKGYSTSVCMVQGKWSHESPSCEYSTNNIEID